MNQLPIELFDKIRVSEVMKKNLMLFLAKYDNFLSIFYSYAFQLSFGLSLAQIIEINDQNIRATAKINSFTIAQVITIKLHLLVIKLFTFLQTSQYPHYTLIKVYLDKFFSLTNYLS